MKIRSPIVSVLGHVDHGKTTLLDNIRGTAIAHKEAGGITQHIGATEIPIKVIEEICKGLLEKYSIQRIIPGLLFIDTPGHEAFTTLRKRGGSLADLAILIVDINEGFKPQTYEALNILKMYKTPFVVAANKIDKIRGWKTHKNSSFLETFEKQVPKVQQSLETKIYELVGSLHEEGFNAERFDRVTDFTSQVSIVPISALTGEGIPELLTLLIGLAQQYLKDQLTIESDSPAKGTILEVKEEKGLGTTLDAIIYDGVLKQNDKIVLLTLEDVVVTRIRSLLKPKPLEEIRESKTEFKRVKEVVAASGVKIVAPGVKDVIPGSPLRVAKDENLEDIRNEIRKELEEVKIETDKAGIVIKADTLGSLEAVIKLLKEETDVPIRVADIGDVSQRDVIEAEVSKNTDEIYGVILAFNVKILPSAKTILEESGVKVFSNNVIYKLIEDYVDWMKEIKERRKKSLMESIIRPVKIRILPGFVFRSSKPAITGIEVLAGKLKPGYNLIREDGNVVGTVGSIQDKGKNIKSAKKGQKVAISIKGGIIGRNIEEGDILYSDIPEKDYKILSKQLKNELTADEQETLEEIVKIKRKVDPTYGTGYSLS